MLAASSKSSILAIDAITCNGLGACRLSLARKVVRTKLYSRDMIGLNGEMLPRRKRAGDGMELCFVWFCACTHAVYLRAAPNRFRFLTAGDWCELVGHGFDPIKLHKPTIHKMMAISNAMDARELTVFMVEEARTNSLLDAARLLPAILTGGSYVDCVDVMF